MKEEKKESMIKWLLNHIWQKDKLYHLIVGTLIYIAGALIFAPYVGLLLAILAGGAKEVYDDLIRTKIVNGKKVKTSNGDPWDYFATIVLPIILFLISKI
jgi:hypothetical protein